MSVDETVCGDSEALDQLSARQLIARLRSESERRVTLRPAPDSMTWLTALLPVKDGVAVYATLTREADRARSDGDERGRGQVMADSLVATLLGATRDKPANPVELGIVMTDGALLAGADDEAHLEGFGPIPAELAREIVCDTLSADELVSIRRLYTSPTTGELVQMDSRRRRFSGNLARFIKLRDRTCRTPWCDAPVRHVDHVEEASDGGPTSAANGEGLCEACNYAKTAHRWRARPGPDGSVTTTLPTGHTISSRPPPIATIRWRKPPIHLHYLLTG